MFAVVPTQSCFAMDMPPSVPRDPVVPVLFVESVVFVILMMPERVVPAAYIVPPTYKDLAMEAPPAVAKLIDGFV